MFNLEVRRNFLALHRLCKRHRNQVERLIRDDLLGRGAHPDPALDAETVAAATGVSARYANAVLAQEGTLITRLIQTRRLARCRQALEDSLQGHRTISEIAYSWGFPT
jgi:AraC-like DNA-binding protein